jgi:hypothetical protein
MTCSSVNRLCLRPRQVIGGGIGSATRTATHTRFPYMFLDATYMDVPFRSPHPAGRARENGSTSTNPSWLLSVSKWKCHARRGYECHGPTAATSLSPTAPAGTVCVDARHHGNGPC